MCEHRVRNFNAKLLDAKNSQFLFLQLTELHALVTLHLSFSTGPAHKPAAPYTHLFFAHACMQYHGREHPRVQEHPEPHLLL